MKVMLFFYETFAMYKHRLEASDLCHLAEPCWAARPLSRDLILSSPAEAGLSRSGFPPLLAGHPAHGDSSGSVRGKDLRRRA